MTTDTSPAWRAAVASFRDLAQQASDFAPLADALARLAASPYAVGLHPVRSMQTLLLAQHERLAPGDEHLRLDAEGGELVIRYVPAGTRDPRLALREPAGIWTRRGADGLALLERALHHLRWVVDYRPTGAAGHE